MFAKTTILGKISNNIELKYSKDGKAFANFTIYVYTKKGEYEYTDFFDCICFGKAAEILNQYFSKGTPVCVSGVLKQERWTDNYGNNRSKIKVIVDELHFVPTLSENNSHSQDKKAQNNSQANSNFNAYDYSSSSDAYDSEIPF